MFLALTTASLNILPPKKPSLLLVEAGGSSLVNLSCPTIDKQISASCIITRLTFVPDDLAANDSLAENVMWASSTQQQITLKTHWVEKATGWKLPTFKKDLITHVATSQQMMISSSTTQKLSY
jgi:hypothetical protein